MLPPLQAMDTDKSGTITVDELRKGLREQGSMVSEEELDALVRVPAKLHAVDSRDWCAMPVLLMPVLLTPVLLTLVLLVGPHQLQ